MTSGVGAGADGSARGRVAETPSVVVYESSYVPRAQRVLLAVAFGAAVPALGAWWRWARHAGAGPSAWQVALGVAVTMAMVVQAFRSRVVFRVTLTADTLTVHRDPGVAESWPLARVRVRAERAVGGWSRSPAALLVVAEGDETRARYVLPDDAHTPGIVDDVLRVQRGDALHTLLDEAASAQDDRGGV